MSACGYSHSYSVYCRDALILDLLGISYFIHYGKNKRKRLNDVPKMKLVKVTAWSVPDPDVGYGVETDKFFDGWLAGEPERAYEIVDGEKVLLNIHYEAYWKNGLLQAKGTWIDGLRQGFWRHYNEDGSIACRGIKIDDRWVGRWQFYDENGQLKLITDGEIVF